MDGNSNKKVRRYLLIYLAFLLLFSGFMYGLERYETAIDRQQIIRLLSSYPELEAEIISLWEKPQSRLPFADDESEAVKKTVRLIEEKYGYEFDRTVSGRAVRLFWGAGILVSVLLMGALAYRYRCRKRKGTDSEGKLRELYECLEQFREGEFDEIPEYEEDTEEWMKLWECLRELGVYFAGLKRELREEENSTKALITDISHQLKTPLASLRMCYELSVGDQLTEEEQREFQEQEEKEIEKLELLLKELVNLSRLETRMIQIRPVLSSLRETITAAVSQIYMKARNKEIEIQVEMDGDMDIRHDPKWTEEAVANVLDNSVKYSGEHSAVTVRVSRLTQNVLIEVEDEGIGIKSEELTKIYQRFYRGEEAGRLVKEGSGVGLYLTRMILERQGGTISAKRKKGKGTVFRMTLPG